MPAVASGAGPRRIVVGITGGIAAYKAVALVRELVLAGHDVHVIATEAALRFVGAPTLEAISRNPVHTDLYEGVAEVRLLPGVRQWLAWAKVQGVRQVVASSGEMANIAAIVSALEIGNYFDALVSGAFMPRSKPDPAIFLQAAGAAGVPPERCLVVEDGVVGIEAARRAGMRCLALTTTHPADRLAGADLVVDSLADLDEATFAGLLTTR